MADLTVKSGATLQLLVAVRNDDGTTFSFAGVTVSAQVRERTSFTLVATLNVVITATPGLLSISQDTASWVPGLMVMDFKFVSGSVVLKSPSMTILVQQAVTS